MLLYDFLTRKLEVKGRIHEVDFATTLPEDCRNRTCCCMHFPRKKDMCALKIVLDTVF